MSDHTILVVDDNAEIRQMVTQALDERGHRVLNAATGAAALRLMDREQPIMVLQDIALPDVDGMSLATELRQRARGPVMVLALSGFTSRAEQARISAGEFDDIIVKPIEPWRLVSLIEAHLPSSVGSGMNLGTNKRVLVVDDDPLQLKLVCLRLSRLGFEVDAEGSGREALAGLSEAPPDAIVCDLFMPQMDGFAFASALRKDPRFAHTPLLLVTSGYVDAADRKLAQRAGADDLVLRTPEQREVVTALVDLLKRPRPQASPVTAIPDARIVDKERSERLLMQLERQVALNSGLAQRCKALSSELAVLAGTSAALLGQQEDIEAVAHDALASCLDASGAAAGVLYVASPDGSLRGHPLGTRNGRSAQDLDSFFGHLELLKEVIAAGAPAHFPSPLFPQSKVQSFLERCGGGNALVVPLVHGEQRAGALLLIGVRAEVDQAEAEDWRMFAQGLANQITQALALRDAFAERRAAERRAVESRAEWKALAEHAPDTITRVDCEGIVRFVNRVSPPRTREEMIGRPWLEQIPAMYHGTLSEALHEVLSSGKPSTHEIMLLSTEGRAEWLSSSIGPVTSGGVIIGAIIVSRHITRKKEEEAQLIVADRMATVGTLAAGVAHEINNPLAAVIANLDLAHRDAVELAPRLANSELLEYLQDAQEAADRVRLIVRDLKVFSRIEEVHSGPTDVRAVLESTLRMTWNEIRHRARLVKDFAETPPVVANESRLGQVFLNLIINATHAIPEGHAQRNEIKVSTRLGSDGMVTVEVKDSGTGMTQELKRRLFTPFFTTKPTGMGTGLGLSVCQKLIAAMGGTIRVESELGRGSTFTVALPPVGIGTGAASEKEPMAGAARATRRGRVLVIDDEDTVAMVIRRALSKSHDVAFIRNAREALEFLASEPPFDVILCDLMMPEMTGMDLHAELMRFDPAQADRMIFVTGGAFTPRARDFLASVPNTRIEKPFDIQKLRALVDERVT